jgi:hypothetical protein
MDLRPFPWTDGGLIFLTISSRLVDQRCRSRLISRRAVFVRRSSPAIAMSRSAVYRPNGRKNLHYLDKYHRRSVAVGLTNRLSATASVKWAGQLEVAGEGRPYFSAKWAAHPAGGNTSPRSERAGVSGPRLEAPSTNCYRISGSGRLTCRKLPMDAWQD